MAFNDRNGWHTGINNYVPALQYASGLTHDSASAFSLGTPALADTDIIANDVDGDAVAGTEVAIDWTSDATYGRGVIITPSADPGAGGLIVDVHGFDYLGQPMVARITIAAGGAVAVATKKAFYRVTKTVIVDAATNAITFDLGTTDELGVPYKGQIMWAKEDGVFVATATMEGTDTQADLTDPATATTGDPRGNYNPTTALDGAKEIIIGMRADNSVNSDNNGGLHGIRHYYA